MKPKSKILLVDDHPMMLKGLRFQLECHPDLEVVGEAATGAQALEMAKGLSPDLILLDVHLSDMDGVDVARRILARSPGIKILALSFDTEIAWVKAALQAGLAGCILKTNTEQELTGAIRQILAGGLYLCPQISSLVAQDYRRILLAQGTPGTPDLSAREREVLRFIAEGLRTKEIAGKLGISDNSVETYRRRLVSKLGFGSTAELTRYAVREGISQP